MIFVFGLSEETQQKAISGKSGRMYVKMTLWLVAGRGKGREAYPPERGKRGTRGSHKWRNEREREKERYRVRL